MFHYYFSLRTTGKTVNSYSVTTLGNIHYAHSYKKEKTTVSDRYTKQKWHITEKVPLDAIWKKLHLTKMTYKNVTPCEKIVVMRY